MRKTSIFITAAILFIMSLTLFSCSVNGGQDDVITWASVSEEQGALSGLTKDESGKFDIGDGIEDIYYSVSAYEGEGGTVTPDKDEAKTGERVTLAVAAGGNYRTGSVYFNGTAVTPSEGIYSFIMPSAAVTVTADFLILHTVSVNTPIEHGTLSASLSAAAAGDTVTVTTGADTGYGLFEQRYNDTAFSGASFTMPDCDVTLYAQFALIEYSVETEQNIAHGTVAADKTSAVMGETVTVTVTPDDGYKLSAGTLMYNGTAIESAGGTYSFVMPAENVNIGAEFIAKPYLKVFLPSVDHADVHSPVYQWDDEHSMFCVTVMAGEAFVLVIAPEAGYGVREIPVTGGALEISQEEGNYTVTVPEGAEEGAEYYIQPVIERVYAVDFNTEYRDYSTQVLIARASGDTLAFAGDTVAVTVTLEPGYSIRVFQVWTANVYYEDVSSYGGAHTYYFTMPAEEVTIGIYFAG